MERQMIYPLIALRGITVFPGVIIHFDLNRKKSIAAVNAAMQNNQEVVVCCQRQTDVDDPGKEDLYETGTLVVIKQVTKLPGGLMRILVEGKQRASIDSLDAISEKFYTAAVTLIDEPASTEETFMEEAAMLRVSMEAMTGYIEHFPRIAKTLQSQIQEAMTLTQILDKMAANMPITYDKKQQVLSAFTAKERFEAMNNILAEEVEIASIKEKLMAEIKGKVEKNQREYILREQMSLIRKELNGEDSLTETEVFLQQLEQLNADDSVKERIKKEINRYETISHNSSESAMERAYIEALLDMPWNNESVDNMDLSHAKEVLEADHYGMEKVKERILEFLAVRQMSEKSDSPIICLVGPPGTGKTSVAKSVAKALNKNYQRICLGGVRDEAEIRGHRRTYVGACWDRWQAPSVMRV